MADDEETTDLSDTMSTQRFYRSIGAAGMRETGDGGRGHITGVSRHKGETPIFRPLRPVLPKSDVFPAGPQHVVNPC
jgi:hypothetical protein